MTDTKKILRIFDFDLTLTKTHTFKQHKFSRSPISFQKNYELGKGYSDSIKKGLLDEFKFDANNISAIATYHNNPGFIAGFVSKLLDKELNLKQTLYSETDPATAIDIYSIEGEEKPLLVSYLPYCGNKFYETLDKLEGKNNQIKHLYQYLQDTNIINKDARVYFYDDSYQNIIHAKKLPNTHNYHIQGSNNFLKSYKKPDEAPNGNLSDLSKDYKSISKQEYLLKNLSKRDQGFYKQLLSVENKQHDLYKQIETLFKDYLESKHLYKSLNQDYAKIYDSFRGACVKAISNTEKNAPKDSSIKELCNGLSFAVDYLTIARQVGAKVFFKCQNMDYKQSIQQHDMPQSKP